MKHQAFLIFICLVFAVSTRAQSYEIERMEDGPFSFSISGVTVNEGSALIRESILFNDPTSPVELNSHSTEIVYKDRSFRFSGTTELNVKRSIVAIQVRTILYDVFGQHMKNLANTEPKDFGEGVTRVNGEWRAFENDVSEMLTTVTYVARVRLSDGTQWVYDADNLQLALSTLDLEQKIGEADED
ncbi:hypothetical protein [Gilvimarinus sp. DA14]|uniref:hypothetical protein n=1 Tax=Gilvimarinus sp. DA14 TaxID=2956798 RepID=UPI0020B8E66F|nr:hypothetical protein [Gilvimarinus sp. DA14]UTF58767.1 hypothetical protein NHM04_09775 [Gilvimarinus sp. DA14]